MNRLEKMTNTFRVN